MSSRAPGLLRWCAGLSLCSTLAVGLAREARAEASSDDEPFAPPMPPEYLMHDGGWLRVHYHPSARDRLRPLFERLERTQGELRALLRQDVLASLEVRVAALPAEAARVAPTRPTAHSGARPASTGHLVWPREQLVVAFLSRPGEEGWRSPDELEHALRRSIATVALAQATSGAEVPRPFREGFAEAFAGSGERTGTLVQALLSRALVPSSELDAALTSGDPARRRVAEAQAGDLLSRLLEERGGRDRLASLTEQLRAGASFDDALRATWGSDLATLDASWRRDVARRLVFAPALVLALLVTTLSVLLRRVLRARGEREARKRLEESARSQRKRRVSPALERRAKPLRGGVPKVEHDGRWHTLH